VPFYFINLLPTSLLYISILLIYLCVCVCVWALAGGPTFLNGPPLLEAQPRLASEQTKMRHIKEDFPTSMDSDTGKRSLHCSNGLYRRVKNSGKDFAKQV